jgi:hypothetical protein
MTSCPYKVGDKVRFNPSKHTREHNQDIKCFGVEIGEIVEIEEIREGIIYCKNGRGGWPWNEWEPVI